MNQYQKAATLVVRVVGSIVAVVGLMGPFYITVLQIAGQAAPAYPTERWAGSIVWLLGGVILALASKPIGRRLGGGLE
jgi:hypothetical protein